MFKKSQNLQSLKISDNEIVKILKKEHKRQKESLELIASENFTSKAVLEANGTIYIQKDILQKDIMVGMNILMNWNY
jgi:glycine/serine hydroxymethyltransferase